MYKRIFEILLEEILIEKRKVVVVFFGLSYVEEVVKYDIMMIIVVSIDVKVVKYV